MAKRPCIDCGALTDQTRCPQHQAAKERDRDARRGNTTARGYGSKHQALRARWAPAVADGAVDCARCGQPIDPDEPWDLGHSDDRTAWTGPEHANNCNRSAGGRNAHQ